MFAREHAADVMPSSALDAAACIMQPMVEISLNERQVCDMAIDNERQAQMGTAKSTGNKKRIGAFFETLPGGIKQCSKCDFTTTVTDQINWIMSSHFRDSHPEVWKAQVDKRGRSATKTTVSNNQS